MDTLVKKNQTCVSFNRFILYIKRPSSFLKEIWTVTDTTNSRTEAQFKATGWVISEILIVNAAHWPAFPPQIQGLRQIQFFIIKEWFWTIVFGLTRLIKKFFYYIKERNNENKAIQVQVRSKKVFLYSQKSLHLNIRLTRLTIPRNAEFNQMISLFFSLHSLCGIILDFCVFTRWLKNGHQLLFGVLNKITCWFSRAVSSSIPNIVEGSTSPLTHTWLIRSEVLPCPHLLVIIEKVKERYSLPSPYPVILIDYYRPLTGKCIRMSYFLVTEPIGIWRLTVGILCVAHALLFVLGMAGCDTSQNNGVVRSHFCYIDDRWNSLH